MQSGGLDRSAQRWIGIIAKRRDLPYESGNRRGCRKSENFRSADCVVGGFRYNERARKSSARCYSDYTMPKGY